MCPSRWTVALRPRQFMFMLFIHSSFTYKYLFVTGFRVLSQLQKFYLYLFFGYMTTAPQQGGPTDGACRTVSSSEEAARLCRYVSDSDSDFEIVRSNLKNHFKRRVKLAEFLARLGTRTVITLGPCSHVSYLFTWLRMRGTILLSTNANN